MKKATFIFLFMVFSTFAINAQVTVSLPDLSAPAGETVFVPVQISGYNNGLSMLNAYVAYDSSVVEYQGLVNFDANMPSGEWQYGTNGEQLGANWFANQPITNPPDEIVLFEIQFLYKGGDCYLLFSNSPFAVEVYDLAYSPYSITFENGSITGNGSDIYIDSTSISKTLVAGTTGESHMTISNIGTGILDYSIEVDYVTEKFDLSFLGKQNNELLEVIDKEIPEGISIKLSDSQIKPLPPTDDIVLRYDNGTKGGELGASGGGFFDVAVFFPDSVMLQYIGHQLENVDIYIDNPAESCELKIYQGGSPGAPGELIYTQPVTVSPYGWNNIVLSTPVPIDGQGLWISFLVENLSGRNPIAVDSGPNSYPGYSDNLTVNGVWTTLASFGYYHNLMITAHLSDDQILNWLTVSPKTGIINAGETETIDLLFNATQLEPGVYNANLEISSNSLSNNFIIVPVELTVTLCDISVTIDTSNYNGFAIDCAGNETGWIKLTIENGTPPYSIEWLTIETTIISDTNIVMIDSLPYGEYFYHLEDFNGCEANDTIYLHQPGMYLVEASTHYACQNNSNGSIFLQVFGGTPPYSFSWSNGATSQNLTNIPAGEYTVWIQDQNDCIFTETYSVDEFICLVGTPTPTCWGDCDGSIDLEVQLGVLPYEYIWIKTDDPYFHETTQDIDSLCAGEYCVTVTDDVGFQSSACFYVEEYGIPQLGFCFNGESINAYDEFVLCQNDWEGVSIDLCIASPGAAPYQIEYEIWLDGNFWHYDYGSYSQGENLFYYFPTSDLDPGTYEFQVLSITDNNGCEHPLDDYTFYFIINPEPEIEICVNEQWSPPGIPHEFCETENIDVSICNVIAGINPFEMCFDIYHDGDLFMDGCNWYFEGDQIIDQILEPGLYEFWFYSIMDGNGCLVNYPEEYNFSIFIQEQAEVYPGQDVTICEGESYFLENASATNYNQLMWLGGNGTFDDPTMLNTTYTPAVGELGGIEICIEVEPVAPCFIVIEDCINLFIQPNPEVDAGMDAIICQGDIYTLYGATASNYSSLMWYGGLGGFNNPGILHPIYTPDAMEVGSTVTLCIEAQAIDPCTVSVSDCMDLFIQPLPFVYPGQDVTICEGESYFLENASATNYNQLMWLGGNGTFDDPTMLNTTYTPAVGELGGIEICIEVEPVAPCFIVIEDCINLFIQPNPEVDAGMDAIICQGDIYTLYGATASNYSSLMWYGGLGGFNNPGILNPIYTPDAMEAGSTVTLCIEAQAIDPCTVSVSDCMDLFIQPLPFVNPGQDVTICEGESYFLENASATNYYQLMWLGGNGTFDDPTMLNTTYTPAMGELGGIEICIEVEPVAPCFIVIEDCINLFIQPNPEVDAGEDATIFAGENFELVDATASNFSSLEWSGGEGYFSNQFMLHPVYFPVFAEYGTTIELCLTADPIQPCTISVIDCMLLTVLNPEAPTITSIYDIPNDQGGWVYIDFLKSVYDTDTLRGTESYTVQRYDEDKWVSVNYMLAYGQDEYTVEARTLTDSSSQDNGLTTFRILAGMDEGNWASQADSGYSMDNLAPFTPEDLKGFALAENTVQLNWSLPVDDDFQYFAIYRSKEDGLFIPYTTTISNQIEDELGIADYSYKVTAFDFNGNESESSEIVSTQNLNLKEGWSGISGYVLPDFAELENVFESVIDDLLILQNMDGIYWPGENVNTLGNWNTNSGYAVKMNNQFNLPLAGKMINEHILDLEAGWKVIPVLSECNVNVADLFNGTDVIIVKDVAGWNIYWPEFGINTLSVLEPGNAYFVLMNSVGEISFPECDGLKVVAPRALSGFQTLTELVTKTASSHTIAIPNSVMENLEIQNGSLIKAYDGSGECFGVGIWQDESTSITLFGDDPLTETKDGFDENEIITFRLWNPENDEEFLIEVSFDPSMPNPEKMFVNNGLSAIASIKVSTSGISDNHDELNIQIIPNPAKDEFMLSIASKISQAGMLKIFSLDGQEVAFETIENENTKIGIHHLESGIYILQIEMNGNTVNKKLLKY